MSEDLDPPSAWGDVEWGLRFADGAVVPLLPTTGDPTEEARDMLAVYAELGWYVEAVTRRVGTHVDHTSWKTARVD